MGGRRTSEWTGGVSLRKLRSHTIERKTGFTLVELLVAIAITAILAAVILTVLPRGREMARRVACTSGVKQIVAGATMYAHDHDRRFIPAMTRGGTGTARGSTWCALIQPYIESTEILICPSDPDPRATTGWVCQPHSYGLNYRYTFNTAFGWSPGALTSKLTNIDRHSKRILVFEIDSTAGEPGGSYLWHRLSRVEARHGDRAVFGFIDGHAETLVPEETARPENLWE